MKKICLMVMLFLLVGCNSESNLQTTIKNTDNPTTIETTEEVSTIDTTTEDISKQETTIASTITEDITTTEPDLTDETVENARDYWAEVYYNVLKQVNPTFLGTSAPIELRMDFSSGEIILPYGFDNPPTESNTYEKAFISAVKTGFYERLTENIDILFSNNGIIKQIEDNIFSDNEDIIYEQIDGNFFIYDNNFQIIIETNKKLTFQYYEVTKNSFDEDVYDHILVYYQEGFGFMIFEYDNFIQNPYDPIENQELGVQMNLTYMSSTINEQSENLYTLIKFESNLVGEDLLISVSNNDYLAFSVFDRYLNVEEVGELELGHIVMMTDEGYYVGDMFSNSYYERSINQWESSFSLSFIDGWHYVDFDGVNWGDIYTIDSMSPEFIVPDYKAAILGTDLRTGQDLTNIEGIEFNEDVLNQIFTFGEDLIFNPKEDLTSLILLSLGDYDFSEIGLSDFYYNDMVVFFIEKQLNFEYMSNYYIE